MTETLDVDEYNKLQAKEMSEETLLQNIIDLAHTYGWLVAHFRPAKTDKGWRTPVQADGKGFPDLVLAKSPNYPIFAEVKSQIGKLSKEQRRWGETLKVSSRFFVWCPSDWFSGEIERILRG